MVGAAVWGQLLGLALLALVGFRCLTCELVGIMAKIKHPEAANSSGLVGAQWPTPYCTCTAQPRSRTVLLLYCRLEAAMQRYKPDEKEGANPMAEQDAWESEQMKRTRMKAGAADAAAAQPQYDFVFEDSIDFIKSAMIAGTGDFETAEVREHLPVGCVWRMSSCVYGSARRRVWWQGVDHVGGRLKFMGLRGMW